MRLSQTGVSRATRTPHGPATIRLTVHDRDIEVWAWGPGAGWALESAPEFAGEQDDPGALIARDPIVGRLQHRLVGLRIGRTGAVLEALVPAILEQKVTGTEAWRSFRAIVRTWSEPAPGPERLWLPPEPGVLAAQPTWEWHRLGVERKRADAIRVACSRSARLEPIGDLDPPVAYRRLTALPGVGRWTAAEVGGRALGDPDAVSVGDFHIPHLVAWTLAGEARGSHARMLELLEPYRGQRGRVIRLIEAGGRRLPRRAPRRALRRIAAI
jgi:3-methyladenine DNA glycosylase/8-oxoguanine DNA glycosylase